MRNIESMSGAELVNFLHSMAVDDAPHGGEAILEIGRAANQLLKLLPQAEPKRFLKILVPADALMCGKCPHARWLPAGRASRDGRACNIFDEQLELDLDDKPKRHAKCLAAELAAKE